MPVAALRTKLRKARSLGLGGASALVKDKLKRGLYGSVSRVPGVPSQVFIESTDRCNLRCVFCDRAGLTRKSGTISRDLFRKIIDNAAEIGVPTVKLNRFGEPLLHPDLPDMVRYAKEKGIPRVHFTSNATLLTEEKSRQLIVAGLDMITFSIDGATKETFERIRAGADYQQVKENILRFVSLRHSLGSTIPWIVITTGFSKDTEKEILDVLATWTPRVDQVHVHAVGKYGNVDDLSPIQRDDHVSQRRPCPSVFERLVIFWDGTATVCCADINGALSVGNANDSRIEDLWQNARFLDIRRKHARRDLATLPLCLECDWSDAVQHRRMQEQVRLVRKRAARAGYRL